ncbi:hypothetical protein LT493_23070 [Streptomyces tricolor]|nr:hypothetical protein [Streptomyces tricolor]
MELTLGALRAFLEWVRDTPRSEWPDFVEAQLDQVIEQTRRCGSRPPASRSSGPCSCSSAGRAAGCAGRAGRSPARSGRSLGILSPLEECARMARALQEA